MSRGMLISRVDLRAYGMGRATKVHLGFRSELEHRFAERLAIQKVAGQIHDFMYEPMSFKLAHDTRYTPDFLLVHNDGTLEFVEVKGKRTQVGRCKFEMAREKFPFFKWTFATCDDGTWRFTPHATNYTKRKGQ